MVFLNATIGTMARHKIAWKKARRSTDFNDGEVG